MNTSKSVLFLLSLALILFGSTSANATPPQDQCSFIREKIADLSTGGGEVLIPSGVYTCLAPIILDQSHIHLRGLGETTLRLGNNVNAPVIVMGDISAAPRPLLDIQVQNLKIDGNRWAQKYECWGGSCDSGGTSFIRNNGITVRAVTKGRVQDIYITSARSGGVVTEKGCFDLNVDGLTVVDSEFDGFAGYETFGARLTHLNLSNNRSAGISLDIRFHGNIFKDVQIEHNGDVGIFMRNSNSNIFENILISDSGNHGVFLAQAEDSSTCPLSNEFQNLSVTRSRGQGFHLNDLCEGNRLTGTATFLQNRDGCLSEGARGRLLIEGSVLCQE